MEVTKVVPDALLKKLSQDFIVPLLLHYVYWVLVQAKERGIKTLYFLARDGYILQKLAIEICNRHGLSIDCKYLCCSRIALRLPSYYLINEEAYDLLLSNGYYLTGKILLCRASLNTAQRQSVWNDCGLDFSAEEKSLDCFSFEQYRHKLRQSQKFRELVENKSRAAYPNAIGYLQQEGLLNASTVAIVDSGWTGSMQRTLRQLLQSAGFHGKLIGFYFGMYAQPKEPEDGLYLTFYFNSKGKVWDKILFCNNLFESLLQAPHGMTTGYEMKEDGKYLPRFTTISEKQYSNIENYIQNIINEARKQIMTCPNFQTSVVAKQEIRALVNRYMTHPTAEEATLLGQTLFCDDVTETYHAKLAEPEQARVLKKYLFFHRAERKLFRQGNREITPELYWPYGAIAFLPLVKQPWYRWNIYLWEWIRFITS